MGKMETLTPCKIETLEQIDIQFVGIVYVHERNGYSKFGKTSVHGGLLGKGVKYNFLCDFIYLFIYLFIFSRTNVQKRPLDGF